MSDNIPGAERMMNQVAVYWAYLRDDDSGDPEYDDPVEIRCRWDDVHEEFVDRHGNTVISNASVIVDRDLTQRGQLWLGELDDLESQTDPQANEGAFEIRKVEKSPNKAATKFIRSVML